MKRDVWLRMIREGCLLTCGAMSLLHCSSDDPTTSTNPSAGSSSTPGGAGMGGNPTGASGALSGGSAGMAVTGGAGSTSGGASGGAVAGGPGGSSAGRNTTGGSSDSAGTAGRVDDPGGRGGAANSAGSGGDAVAGKSGTSGMAGTSGGGPCGEAAPGMPFPPLTSYTANDGGFGYVATRNASDATSGPVAIFRPSKYGEGGVKHPIVVWGNGRTNTVDIWARFLQRVASYGFVVVAPEQTMVSAAHMNAAIDYALRLAVDPSGMDCGKIDMTKLGATGYSQGGGGAIGVASDPRITATFVFAALGTNNARNIKAPWAGTFAENDEFFAWSTIKPAVQGSTQPAFGGMLLGTTHNSLPGNAKSSEAYIGFLRWRFMGDDAGKQMFVGSSCKICTDTAFGEVVKTASWDSL